MPAFSASKVAFVYVKLPPGNFTNFAREIVSSLPAYSRSKEERITCFWALGGADLLIRLDLESYRSIPDMQQALAESAAEATSWLFAVPYRSKAEGECSESMVLHFLMQLRVRRTVYASHGVDAETLIFDNIARIAKRHEGRINVEVLAGLGWADIVIAGAADCDQNELLEFILHIRELAVLERRNSEQAEDVDNAHCSREPVFQRSITTVGFSCNADFEGLFPEREFSLLAFLRSQPGHFFEAYDRSGGRQGNEAFEAHWIGAIDGTYDLGFHLSLRSRPEEQRVDIGQLFHAGRGGLTRLQEDEEEKNDTWPIERSRSHILITDPSEVLYDESIATLEGVTPQPLKSISPPDDRELLEVRRLARALIEKSTSTDGTITAEGVLPRSLQHNILWLAGVLKGALQDSASYSDAFSAIESCISSAHFYLEQLEAARSAYLESLSALERSLQLKRIEAIRKSLESWCLYVPRIVTERSAGRFGDLFGDGSHIFASIGGLQKTLLIADLLASEFQRRIIKGLAGGSLRNQGVFSERNRQGRLRYRKLASIFDAVDGIRSFPKMGIIRLPIRHRFSLPRVLPGIWHEVAQTVFVAFFPDEELSIKKIESLVVEAGTETAIILGDRSRQQIPPDLHPADMVREESLYREMTDIFSDILVALAGFGKEDFEDFSRDLCVAAFEDILAAEMLDEEREKLMVNLVTRLLICEMAMDCLGSGARLDFGRFSGLDKVAQIPKGPIARIIEVARKKRYEKTWVGTDLLGALAEGIEPESVVEILAENTQFLDIFGAALASLSDPAYLRMLDHFLDPLALPVVTDSLCHHKRVSSCRDILRFGSVTRLPDQSLNDHYYEICRLDMEHFLQSRAIDSKSDKATLETTTSDETLKERAALARSTVCTYFSQLGV